MAPKTGSALAVRLAGDARRTPSARTLEGSEHADRPRLRLVVTKGRLGVELDQPFDLGPVRVATLHLLLPDIQFPVELTGGPGAFRNRRGRLESLSVGVDTGALQRWARARLRGLIGEGRPDVLVAPVEDGWLIGLAQGRSALRFELLAAPLAGDVRLIVESPQGFGLGAPSHQLALRATELLTRPYGQRRGGIVVVQDAVAAVARALLPLCGMRAPAAAGVGWSSLSHAVGGSVLEASSSAPPPVLTERVVRAVERSVLAFEGDDALCRSDLDAARREYMTAMAQAPRHLALAHRVAEIDACVGGRAEAALGTLAEAEPVIDAGPLAGRLLLEVGDRESAHEAYRRSAERELYGALAALCWAEMGQLATGAADRMAALDRAVARAPLLAAVRWQRLEARLVAGDLRGVRDDAAHLEAAASSAHERHDVSRTVADALRAAGHDDLAAERYERALRYVPDSVTALAGLARSYLDLGRGRRALDLLGRALALAERTGQRADEVQIELAKALVSYADDRPAAIAHVRAVAPLGAHTFEARALEARWRSEIGDLAGASVALGRLARAVEQAMALLLGQSPSEGRADPPWGQGHRWQRREDACVAIASMLLEGATLQEEQRNDRAAARVLISLALRLAPRDPSVRRAHRRWFAEVASPAPKGSVSSDGPDSSSGAEVDTSGPVPSGSEPPAWTEPPLSSEPPCESEPPLVPASPRSSEPGAASTGMTASGAAALGAALDLGEEPEVDPADEELIAQLTERLRAAPSHRPTILALADALERAKRSLDLLALLTAAMEEGDDSLRSELRPRMRAVLERLRDESRRGGLAGDASLYEQMLVAMDER